MNIKSIFLLMDDLRREYNRSELSFENLHEDPIAEFQAWLQRAIDAKCPDANAFYLATVDSGNRPRGRIVLIKKISSSGLVFFTNYESDKGRELANNPAVSATFYWSLLERQVRIEGWVQKTSQADSEAYFRSRPYWSQVSALASKQSQLLNSRKELESLFSEVANKYSENVPRPKHWGGYEIKPDKFEFWQGRENRLHDRVVYEKDHLNWSIYRICP